TAPAMPGTYTITATLGGFPDAHAEAIVTVQDAIVTLSTRNDDVFVLSQNLVTREQFPGAPLRGVRNRTLTDSGVSVSHNTNADDAGGQLAFSHVADTHATAFTGGGDLGATSHEELSFAVAGSPVQFACSGSMNDDGVDSAHNQSGAALIVDGVT